MSEPQLTVLAIGATGSIGRHVIGEALHHGTAFEPLYEVEPRFIFQPRWRLSSVI